MRSTLFILILLFSGCNRKFKIKEIEKNYIAHKIEFSELYDYIKNNTPDSIIISIEFKNDIAIRDFEIIKISGQGEYETLHSMRNFSVGDSEFNRDLQSISWNLGKINLLKKYLDKCNCISITGIRSDSSIKIMYLRTGNGGAFLYNFFPQKMPNDFKEFIHNRCNYKAIDSNTTISYEAGATGSDCLPNE